MKKFIVLLMAACLMLCLCACGTGVSQSDFEALEAEVEQLRADVDALQGNGEGAEKSEATEADVEETEEDEAEYDPNVDCIDLVLDEGELKYTGFEEANDELTDEDNVMLFEFEFTNFESMPAEVQENFRIQFFQNGTEMDTGVSYYVDGSDQSDLLGAFYDDVLNGGTIAFAKSVILDDDSPITIMVSRNGGSDDTECQMMEVDISGGADAADTAGSDVSAEQVDADLQGDWALAAGTGAAFSFDDGNVTISSDGTVMTGTYEVNTADSMVDATLTASDANVNIHIPYYYEDGALVIANNDGDVLVKQ